MKNYRKSLQENSRLDSKSEIGKKLPIQDLQRTTKCLRLSAKRQAFSVNIIFVATDIQMCKLFIAPITPSLSFRKPLATSLIESP